MKLSLRLLFGSTVFLFVLYFVYSQLPPSYNLIRESELRTSLDVEDRDSQKYVWFKQLQGAGFNNQVSSKATGAIHELIRASLIRFKKSFCITI